MLWEPYPSHHNGLFSPLLVLRDFGARKQINIGVIQTVRDFSPFLCNSISLVEYNLLSNIRVCVFISDPFRGHNRNRIHCYPYFNDILVITKNVKNALYTFFFTFFFFFFFFFQQGKNVIKRDVLKEKITYLRNRNLFFVSDLLKGEKNLIILSIAQNMLIFVSSRNCCTLFANLICSYFFNDG